LVEPQIHRCPRFGDRAFAELSPHVNISLKLMAHIRGLSPKIPAGGTTTTGTSSRRS
jgi:hypothetical protein